ncbi:hypothetical protein [Leucobacter komagatae]|uniref:HEPN AbiU2-like domain-containing protein n=1 Tax=Leucobacter komagatae TaxID=55969 RepID=A0A0D0H2U0_9MICO|nr:hypothetical protein [Leucobacter komagatae]KIP51455.1 hypothetical protein SD72_15370 [Leucobacter komagatae]
MATRKQDSETWDARRFAEGASKARETVEQTAYFIVSAKKRPGWESHRPGVELVFYLALIDYETKALVYRLLESPEDRYVWEKYLALHLYEVLERAPLAISEAIREMSRPGSASKADPELHKAAARQFREDLRPIRQDTDFMKALSLIRNAVAAHHADKKSATMDPSITWMLTTATQRNNGGSPMSSQILEYSVRAAMAVQDFAHASIRGEQTT